MRAFALIHMTLLSLNSSNEVMNQTMKSLMHRTLFDHCSIKKLKKTLVRGGKIIGPSKIEQDPISFKLDITLL